MIKNTFDLKQTNISKGIALMLLLWHHLFYNNPAQYDSYKTLFAVGGVPIEAYFADFCKVCVAVFLVLSGLGMYKSYAKYCKTCNYKKGLLNLSFVIKRLLKLYVPYWMIYIIFVPMGLLFGRSFIEIYESGFTNFFIDFFGLAYLSHGWLVYTMNATWWYMSIIIVFCIIYPVLHKALEYSPELTLTASLLLCFSPLYARDYFIWLVPFVLGMYISKRQAFEKISLLISKNPDRVMVSGLLVAAFAMFRFFLVKTPTKIDFAFGFSIILFSFFVLSGIPLLNRVLEELGKKSGLIFMFHTFIFSYYFHDFIYSFKYPPIIFIVLLVICYAVAWIIQKFMEVIGLTGLLNRLFINSKNISSEAIAQK